MKPGQPKKKTVARAGRAVPAAKPATRPRKTVPAPPPPVESPRDRVLRISAELFAAQGFDATGIRDIEAAVGLGRGALYYHIGSKDKLLTAISMSSLDRLITNSQAAVGGQDPADAKLRRLAKALFDHFTSEGARAMVALTEVHSVSDDIGAVIRARRDEYEAMWTDVFAQGAAEGLWKDVTPVVRRGIIGMFRSTRTWLRGDGAIPTDTVADEYVDVLLHGLP
jgi:TetR/AcrR family transcriptional regulator, cholesterol catabolism regulator